MARVLFVTWRGGGNQPPAIGIGQELRDRGHEVVFAGYEPQRPRFEEHGFRFIVLERAWDLYQQEAGAPVMATLGSAVWVCRQHAHDLQDALAGEQPDAVVVDCLMFGALAAAENIGLPTVVLVHSAPGALVPPGGFMDGLLLGAVNDLRAADGRAAVTSLWEVWSPFPTLCTSIPELDPLAARVPPSFEYVGPVFERVPPSGWRPPWDSNDPRPLVLVSFSTGTAWDQASRIQRTLEALAGDRCWILVTTGAADVSGLPVPKNAVLVPQVPHAEILPRVAVTVTHAGHGTVTTSLAHGVPLVCLPNPAADQPPLAAQVAALGAGRALDGETATSGDIAEAVDDVLTDRSYATAAQRLAEVIASSPGAVTAASRLESLAE